MIVCQTTRSTTWATANKLPADTDLNYRVFPNPREYFESYGPLAEDWFNRPCPSTDLDDPNVVCTLALGGFNSALILRAFHPQPYIDLKDSARLEDFEFVIDARDGPPVSTPPEFVEQLFRPVSEGGQGYSQHPDIYGWQTGDEPLVYPCEMSTLDRLTQEYDEHKDATDQLILHVEVDPKVCSHSWDDSVRIGDAAHHGNYMDYFGPPMLP